MSRMEQQLILCNISRYTQLVTTNGCMFELTSQDSVVHVPSQLLHKRIHQNTVKVKCFYTKKWTVIAFCQSNNRPNLPFILNILPGGKPELNISLYVRKEEKMDKTTNFLTISIITKIFNRTQTQTKKTSGTYQTTYAYPQQKPEN
jgi:hypothetical protein